MNKLTQWIKGAIALRHQHDKQLHWGAGVIITLAGNSATGSPIWGIALALIVGGLKEWYDGRGHGSRDLYDWVYTALGAISGALLAILVGALRATL